MLLTQNHLAKNAQGALQNHLREQEDRKRALLREQQMRELRQCETNLFHKQQEALRIKTQLDRLKREAVVRESNFKNSIQNTQKKNNLRDLEKTLDAVVHAIQTKLQDINKKIEQKKRELELLEKEKQETIGQGEQQKKNLNSSIRVAQSTIQSAEQYEKGQQRIFETTQRQITTLEQSLKIFNQDIMVLDNKVKALKSVMK